LLTGVANRSELIKGDADNIAKYVQHQNHIMDRVRQTADATVDSRVMLDLSDTMVKRFSTASFGNSATTLDVNKFVSKCMRFMRQGQQVSRTSEDSDVEDNGPELNWDRLGDLAFACNRRPAVPRFLLGPLSVEKRVRVTQRSARLRGDGPTAVSRPDELNPEDLEKNENANLTVLCEGIRERLKTLIHDGADQVSREQHSDMEEDEAVALFRKHHLSTNYEVSLFEFAVNPQSFGQTVENLFYISFLVRDGYVRLGMDEDGLPTLRKYFCLRDISNLNRRGGTSKGTRASWTKHIKASSHF
jgi:non-structural maintenance of chromosomes element 4